VKASKAILRAKPPSLRDVPNLDDPRLAAFLGGAERSERRSVDGGRAPIMEPEPAPAEHPWHRLDVRADVTKLYNLRLPEAYLLKLRYIADHTPLSMQRFCLELLLPAIDSKIEELTGEKA
jgi:hypothetical protein